MRRSHNSPLLLRHSQAIPLLRALPSLLADERVRRARGWRNIICGPNLSESSSGPV